MNIFHAIVLGIIQGLSEFLPISSSAHLVIAPWLFKWSDPGLGFDVALHMGTLLAVVAFFWRDLRDIIKGFFRSLPTSTRDTNNIYQRLAWLLIIASVPGAIIGKLFESAADSKLRNPLLIAGTMLIGAIILFAADRYGRKQKNLGGIKKTDALAIGLAQAVAIFPGISRSGASISAGLGLGFSREDAAKFSFLMSVPIILGAGILELKNFHQGVTSGQLAAGFIASAVFGFLSIRFLMRYISKNNYKLFVWYRVGFAVLIALVYFIR